MENPFIGFNETKAEWVGTKSWTYRTKFKKPSASIGSTVVLAFDGLDTFAHVRLNGKIILESENMFLPQRVDITHAVESQIEHELEIEFDPALLKAREIEKQHPEHKFICFNGDTARLCVRKAQCHWGWDWGPVLMCAGIWRPVRIEVYTARISDLRTNLNFSQKYETVNVEVITTVEGHHKLPLQAKFCISLDGKTLSTQHAAISSEGTANITFELEKPSLWMPNGYGKQTLYDVTVTLLADGEVLHSDCRRIGMREVKLVQEPDSHGKSFYFRINGVDIFCGGSCWIPADSILTNIPPEKLRSWIELMVPANQKMIR